MNQMKAAMLVKNGPAEKAFEIRETAIPDPEANEVRIKVQAFGLNFADVMARLGLYDDAPPKPAIVGYDVIGHVDAVGADIKDLKEGQRVIALTRFGGYAEYVCTDARGVVPIDDSTGFAEGTALATQYGTAYYAAAEMVNIYAGDHVLIQAAAGGVGTALVQYAKHKGATVYGTASGGKQDYLQEIGVDHPIDYTKTDFDDAIKKLRPEGGIDVAFDSIGGSHVKKAMKLLAHGGRMVSYGAASMTNTNKNPFKMMKVAAGFGIWSPIWFLQNSRGLIGVNMLRIADHKPDVLKRVLTAVVDLYKDGVFKPTTGKEFPVSQLAEAHEYLGGRKSIGKVAVYWE